jgi:hypothetical protein
LECGDLSPLFVLVDLSASEGAFQRPNSRDRAMRCECDGDKSPAQSGDKSPHSKGARHPELDYFLLGTFIDKILAPWVTTPLPPLITRRTGRPVLGSVLSAGSLIFCSTSNRRGFVFASFGIVS